MAYNKARAERIWKQWKEKEERKLRLLGMDEDSIQKLRADDWKEFNEERRFREHQILFHENMDFEDPNPYGKEITEISDLLNCIGDERIFHILLNTDKKTLQLLLLKILGYSGREISEKTGINENTIRTKIDRLRKKLKKFV